MSGETVGGLLLEQARRSPSALAIDIDGTEMSWQLLHTSAMAAAHWLREHGIDPGRHVALLLPTSLEWAVWAYACALAGNPYVPVNPRLRPDELRYVLSQSDATAVVHRGRSEDPEHAVLSDVIGPPDAGTGWDSYPELRAVIALQPCDRPWVIHYGAPRSSGTLEKRDQHEILMLQYTSGTTASPKAVMLTHANVLINARGVAERLHISATDRVAAVSPFFHVAGTTLHLYLGLVTGAPIFGFARFDPGAVLACIVNHDVTVYSGVDAFFLGLITAPGVRPEAFAGVQRGWIAAPAEMARHIQRSGFPGVANVFGLSEAGPNVCIADAADSAEARASSGYPHSGTRIRIVDAVAGAEVPTDTVGAIEVTGPCIMRGYYSKPQETAAAFTEDGWLRTGDLGRIDPAGNLYYEARAKDILRVGGENVAPAEIEAVLLQHPDIGQVVVVAAPHAILMEVPVAVVVARAGHRIDAEHVVAFASERLAPHKVPRRVDVWPALPMTGSGKIQKSRVRELIAAEGG